VGFIRKFMIFFGPMSSVFDFITFGVMLWAFHAGPALFRSGWFVESLATQTLVIFAIRTRRVPFFRSRPSMPLLLAALAVVAVGAALPFTPLAHLLGFRPLPAFFFLALTLMVISYLVLIEVGKRWFYRLYGPWPTPPSWHRAPGHRLRRRAARFASHSFRLRAGRTAAIRASADARTHPDQMFAADGCQSQPGSGSAVRLPDAQPRGPGQFRPLRLQVGRAAVLPGDNNGVADRLLTSGYRNDDTAGPRLARARGGGNGPHDCAGYDCSRSCQRSGQQAL
jgi:hypothetical protein